MNMREFGPNTTTPSTGGAAAAAAASSRAREAASSKPAMRMTRRPPDVGTVNGSDTSGSSLTVVSARASDPTGRSVNSARPWSSVMAVLAAPPAVTRTSWPTMLFPMASRTTRTVTVPFGSSGAGMARP